MLTFAGIDHLGLSVTDLDRSERFYSEVLGLTPLVDFGYVRMLIDRPSGFLLSLIRHDAGTTASFTELTTGLDHVGLAASSRDELVEWERRFDAYGVPYTPIRDMEFGYHLNFRDPDNIALELNAPNDVWIAWRDELRTREVPRDEINARVTEYLAAFQV